jgi:hypothetical protein
VNTAGANVGAEAVVPIDVDEIVATACATAGLDDFGTDTWREPYAVLIDAIAREARLTTLGRLLTRAELLRTLVNRLRVEAVHAQQPALAVAPVTTPLFITGTARSGTSILHELLAQDPGLRAPRAWEVLYSVPPPAPGDEAGTDARVATTDREVRLWDQIAPEYLTMHENGGDLPLECIFLTAHELASEHFSGVLDVPSYAAWMAAADLRPAYAWHRRHLQELQARTGPSSWVLKAPSHLSALPALFATYPDAWVVQTHRDPARTVASTVSLMATLRRMRSDEVDSVRLARVMAKGMALLLDRVDELRASGAVPAARFVDVSYRELVTDPLHTIARVYERIERPFTPEARAAMGRYLAAKPQGKHGAHRYTLADFGLDPATVHARFAGYCTRHAVTGET